MHYPRPTPVTPSLQPVAHTSAPRNATRFARGGWLCAGAALAATALGMVPAAEPTPPGPQIVSGAAQVRYTEAGDPQRWGSSEVTLYVDPALARVSPAATDAVSAAVAAWKTVEKAPRIQVATRGDDSGDQPAKLGLSDLVPDGKNTVSYRRLDIPGHRRDLAITVAYANPRTGELLEADIFINARRDFGLLSRPTERQPSCSTEHDGNRCDQRFDLQSVVTHELGHFLGLGEDTEDPLSTMFECTSPCETHKRVLSEADSTSAAQLYLAEVPDGMTDAGTGCSVRRLGNAAPEGRTLSLFACFALLVLRRSSLRARLDAAA